MFKNIVINDHRLYPILFNLECLVNIIQRAYYIQDSLKNRLSTYKQFLGPFCRITSARQDFFNNYIATDNNNATMTESGNIDRFLTDLHPSGI